MSEHFVRTQCLFLCLYSVRALYIVSHCFLLRHTKSPKIFNTHYLKPFTCTTENGRLSTKQIQNFPITSLNVSLIFYGVISLQNDILHPTLTFSNLIFRNWNKFIGKQCVGWERIQPFVTNCLFDIFKWKVKLWLIFF